MKDLLQKARDKNIPLRTIMTKEELESAISSKPGTIGWRLRYIRPHVEDDSELRQVMYMLLSPVRDLSRYPKVERYLKNHDVYITLTTSPMRLPKVKAVLATLDLTNVKRIYVVLPQKYGHKNRPYNKRYIESVKKFPKVTVIRTKKDYGPLTKMLPVLRRVKDKKATVISIDDDVAYPMGMVNEMIYTKVNHPKKVIESGPGLNIRSWIPNFRNYWPENRPRAPLTDMVEGWSGIAYSPALTDTKKMEELADISKQCYLSDDLVISYVLANKGVPRKTVDNKYMYHPQPLEYGAGEDALHKGGGTGTVAQVAAHSDEYNFEKYLVCLRDIEKHNK